MSTLASSSKTRDRDDRPVLIIVMGTSGSGKSTLGTRLAAALGVPFVDGDDLHPAENVAKMSAGHPLDDADRLPWLLRIREKAAELCKKDGDAAAQEQHASNMEATERQRELAEVHETSSSLRNHGHVEGIDKDKQQNLVLAQEHAKRRDEQIQAEKRGQQRDMTNMPHHAGDDPRKDRRPAIVIACSALKKHYRQILRHGVPDRQQEGAATTAVGPDDLRVFHVYLRVSPQELRRRMHQRKGHFMKESMLQSQLDTLEEPAQDEPDCFTLDDKPIDELVAEGARCFEQII